MGCCLDQSRLMGRGYLPGFGPQAGWTLEM
jgi:hypothetical protein